jgi:hypothetical protein
MEKGGKKVEGSLVGSFDSMAKGIGASMAAAFTVQAVVGAAKVLLDFGGQLADQAEALGVNTEVLQGFQGAMAGSGVSAEKFTKGMATLISSIQQAKEDSGTARDSFAALGIEFDSIAKDSPDKILLKIADGLKNAKDPAAAYAAALDLVGQNQINFVAALKGGSAAFAENASKIKVLSDEEVKAIDDIGNAWDAAVLKAKAYAAQALLALAKPEGIVEEIGTSTVYNPSMQYGMGMGRPSDFKAPMEKQEMLGPEYTPPVPVVEDPRVKKARDEEEKRLVERGDMIRKLEAQDVKDKEKNTDQMRQANEEYAKMEADSQKMADDHFEALKKTNEKKAKEAAKDALQDQIKQKAQDLQQAQQVTAKAEKETVDARSSLQRALEGNPDARETGQQKQVKRTMKQLEKQLEDPEPGKKRTELGSSLDDERKSTSSRRGTKKALEELKTAKDAEKAAKKAEDLIEEQQKDMVKALKAIDKGINGN